MTREMFQHTSDMALANGVTDGETWPYISLGAGYRRCLVSVPDAPDGNATVPCNTQDNDVFGKVRAPTACELSRWAASGTIAELRCSDLERLVTICLVCCASP